MTIGHLMMAQIDEEEMPDASEYIMNRNGVDFIPSSMVLSAVDVKLRLEMDAERMLLYLAFIMLFSLLSGILVNIILFAVHSAG